MLMRAELMRGNKKAPIKIPERGEYRLIVPKWAAVIGMATNQHANETSRIARTLPSILRPVLSTFV
jgi:hypothetical protein